MARILITGAGGPAAICVFNALAARRDDVVVMADMDVHAAGLYLVPADRRVLLPAGADPRFVDRLLEACIAHECDRVLPTVDAELVGVSERRAEFEARGIRVMLAPTEALQNCLDKARLHAVCIDVLACPGTVVAGEEEPIGPGPWIAKPRRGSGSRGIRTVTRETLHTVPHDGEWLIQEMLPGAEYSVDVLVAPDGEVMAAVPRERLKVDSGVAVTARTVRDPVLMELAAAAARATGLRGVANVQLKRDASGAPRLLEINPRFPGTMALTVRAGADLPCLWMDALDGKTLTAPAWEEIAIVRTFVEHTVDPHVFDRNVA